MSVYVRAPACQALGLLSVAEVEFFLPVTSKHSCLCVHVYVFVYANTCLCVLFFHTVQTHMCLSLM